MATLGWFGTQYMLGELDREISLFCRMMLWTLIPAADTVQVVWEEEGGSDWMAPGVLPGVAESVISGKTRVGRSHPHYSESSFR